MPDTPGRGRVVDHNTWAGTVVNLCLVPRGGVAVAGGGGGGGVVWGTREGDAYRWGEYLQVRMAEHAFVNTKSFYHNSHHNTRVHKSPPQDFLTTTSSFNIQHSSRLT